VGDGVEEVDINMGRVFFGGGGSVLGSWVRECVGNRYVLSINCWYFGGIRSCRSKGLGERKK